MAIIAISRELGSYGIDNAQQVAKALGYDYVDRQVLEGVFRQYGLTKYKDLTTSALGLRDIINANNLLIISMLNEILEALAHRGNVVIMGRGSFAILNDYEDVLTVRIQAPFSVRVDRVMEREGLSDRAIAEAQVRENDRIQSRFVQMFYAKRWDQETHFNLVVDTGSLSSEMAVNWIIEGARALEAKEHDKGATLTSGIEVDPVLMDAINKAMAHPLPNLLDDSGSAA